MLKQNKLKKLGKITSRMLGGLDPQTLMKEGVDQGRGVLRGETGERGGKCISLVKEEEDGSGGIGSRC